MPPSSTILGTSGGPEASDPLDIGIAENCRKVRKCVQTLLINLIGLLDGTVGGSARTRDRSCSQREILSVFGRELPPVSEMKIVGAKGNDAHNSKEIKKSLT